MLDKFHANYSSFQMRNNMRIRTPRNLSFDLLNDVKVLPIDNVMFDYGRLRKIIQRPERVRNHRFYYFCNLFQVRITDIHNTITNENVPLPGVLASVLTFLSSYWLKIAEPNYV